MADIDVSIFDSVSAQEDISSFLEIGLSVYDTIAVAEYAVVYDPVHFYTDPRDAYKMMLPVWELVADFHKVFDCSENLKSPGYSILAHCGAILDERLSTRSLSGSIGQDYGFSGSRNIPVYGGVGYFGGSLRENLPGYTAVLEFAFADVFVLDKEISPWALAASFLYPDLFSLSRQITIWKMQDGSLDLTEMGSYLVATIPFYKLSSTMLLMDYMELLKRIPVWRLESSIFTGDFNLSSNLPVWIVEAVTEGSLFEDSRFSDYVLRYIRP